MKGEKAKDLSVSELKSRNKNYLLNYRRCCLKGH
jgi:hypothetical protein